MFIILAWMIYRLSMLMLLSDGEVNGQDINVNRESNGTEVSMQKAVSGCSQNPSDASQNSIVIKLILVGVDLKAK